MIICIHSQAQQDALHIQQVGTNSGPRDLAFHIILQFPIHSVLALHTVPVQVTVVNAYHHHIINPALSLSPMFNKCP